ncbi:MAG TPA: DCC1-like thiol-disulfide oxidoreductase family protein [Alphaproteobacteria bacterium]
MSDAPTSRPVLIFDGVCKLCAAGVRLVLRYDRAGAFDFAFAQGAVGSALKRRFGMPPAPDTVTVVDGDRVYVKSDAALYVASRLPFPWPLLGVLRVLPRRWRDRLYDLVARHRYDWFGRRDACLPPPPGAAARFLDKP